MDYFVAPHGGELVSLLANDDLAEQLKHDSRDYLSITLSQRQTCDLELLLNGGFSPLRGFMGRADYEGVVERMRLVDGTLWPIPIVLDVTAKFAEKLQPGSRIALRDAEGFMPAVLTVQEIWQPDKQREAEAVYGTTSDKHPGVRYLYEQVQDTYISGTLEGTQLPTHYEFQNLWDTPEELRALFTKMGWRKVVAFQTSKPMHRLQRDIALQAAKDIGGHILLHPTVGMTKPGDLHYYARVHCYQAIRRHFPHDLAALSLLPLAMRMAGPREALWHAIVHQNFGCSHMIVGPKHAYPPTNNRTQNNGYPLPPGEGQGEGNSDSPFYAPYASQELLARYQDELNITVLPIEAQSYVPSKDRFLPVSQIEKQRLDCSEYTDAQLKKDLALGNDIPDWFSYPEVVRQLRRVYPSRSKQGFTLFFTGFSGSGKSTLAKIIYAKLVEAGGRPVSLLDGDIVRQHLSSELGFSKIHRDLNIRRIGFVASEITKNGGVAICAPIAPYHSTRRAVREMIEDQGSFIEIHVATPLEVCEARDRKGLYAKARLGLIPEFTGISDPYEVPEDPEMRIDTSQYSAMEAVQEIYLYLLREGYLAE
ncbi:MAG: bifunctional sulfate adenylyltransferase/adenylylsulfate kinase [Gammaproteobacteria bacterium]|nr:bifunctional sulfate adenylyltransferase/adenylylsulfate kinase [Gammaproteobacteria bacterium]